MPADVLVYTATPAQALEVPLTPKDLVQRAFPNDKVMWFVAECESQYNQFKDGEVLRGIVNPLDVGVFQINEFYHLQESKRLGYDIHSLEGNIAYGKVLYMAQGTKPWDASKPCWEKKLANAS